MFFEPVFSKCQCGFRKGHSAHNCLLMIEKYRKCQDRNGACGALLTDLSIACECLPHFLSITKLHAYGFHKSSTEYLKDYFSHRNKRQK